MALCSALREQRGMVLTPEQQSTVLHGTSQLYLALRSEVDIQLQKFETYALETCLHVPAGLLVEAAVRWPSVEGQHGSGRSEGHAAA